MIFSVMGFHPGRDDLVFEHSISLSVADLIPVMQWTNTNECVGVDIRLIAAQVLEVEHLASVVFPEGLDLYLTSFD
ncbi:hypothetical protein ACIPIN_20480 [Pseudomonas sp. NPDC087697]|uniref:hypothetical protein n=1 Tax=Pseudomonas sp. NPDC087697 TaxID=3364447 RepID=UPI0037FD6357